MIITNKNNYEKTAFKSSEIIDFLETWVKTTTVLPKWVTQYYEKQLIDRGIEYHNLADSNYSEIDNEELAEYWAKGALLLDKLLTQYPQQPEWVTQYHQKQLLEGGVACAHIADSNKGIADEKAAEYWIKGALLLDKLLAQYPQQPEWVTQYHQKQLLEGGIACAHIADSNKGIADEKAAEYWIKGALLLDKLLAQYPQQPEWVTQYHQKQLLEISHISNEKPTDLSVTFHFVNTPRELSGLVKLSFIIQSTRLADSVVYLTIITNDDKKSTKEVKFDSNGILNTWFGIHTHLLENGEHVIKASLLNISGFVLWSSDISFLVKNTGTLSKKVSDSLEKNKVHLFVDDLCDASTYDYKDNSILPWFDSPNATSTIDEWLEDGKISNSEAQQLKHFVEQGYMVIENLIDDELILAINEEIDDAVNNGYRGYKDGSSQRMEHLHNIYPNINKLFLDRRYLDIVDRIFQQQAKPCQSLTYKYGSQQDAHQDTIHLTPFPAGYMCGVWISLEDIKPNSGELEVYPKSHRLDRIYMNAVPCKKVKKDWNEFTNKVVSIWRDSIKSSNLEKITYQPKKGTVLIWHENLMHGGSVRRNLDISRRSIVFHCFANGSIVFYDSTGEVGYVSNTYK